MSQPTRAASIEIFYWHAERAEPVLSQPTRAAWIEIEQEEETTNPDSGRSPLGLRGLKYPLQIPAAFIG